MEKMRGIFFIVLFTLMAVSFIQSLPLQVNDEELAVEVNERVNAEIDFDLTLQKYNLTAFRTLLMQAKLFKTLNDTSKSHTVFAPTNKAIMNAKSVLSNTTRLPEVLMYHVHLGAFPTSKVEQNMKLKTLLGGQKKIRFERYKGNIYGSCKPLGSVKDQTYNNGILDTMDEVMVPPEGDIYDVLKTNPELSSFFKYVNSAGLQQLLHNPTPTTLLVPNNDAFDKLSSDVKEKMSDSHRFLVEVLEYHILEAIICLAGFENGAIESYEGKTIDVAVSGTKVVFNSNSTLTVPDTIAYNGVLQIIDKVLIPATYN